ncbi:MAG: Rrf2 family transcriptional regulator [Candidatus Margulisiibacteriota bacterium]
MKFSIRVQYGLQAMLELALKYGGGPIQIADIAKNQKIPIRYLEQLLLVLKRRGVVASTRGKHGGYSLAKHPSDIAVLEIIEAF